MGCRIEDVIATHEPVVWDYTITKIIKIAGQTFHMGIEVVTFFEELTAKEEDDLMSRTGKTIVKKERR